MYVMNFSGALHPFMHHRRQTVLPLEAEPDEDQHPHAEMMHVEFLNAGWLPLRGRHPTFTTFFRPSAAPNPLIPNTRTTNPSLAERQLLDSSPALEAIRRHQTHLRRDIESGYRLLSLLQKAARRRKITDQTHGDQHSPAQSIPPRSTDQRLALPPQLRLRSGFAVLSY